MSWIQRDMAVYPSVFAGWHRPETDPFFGTPIRCYHDLKNISIVLEMIIQTAPELTCWIHSSLGTSLTIYLTTAVI